ncbi:MAG: helix-turn-helix domain-containing protein [Solirubrobacteraceae bacterium]|nr:helix-turn-helix domain-containing protein [Patulibacter sp.]
MLDPSLPTTAGDRPAHPERAASVLLAEGARRAVIAILGAHGGPLASAVIAERAPLDVTPRLIRDRIRELERHGVLSPVDQTPGGTGRWQLTTAGQELFRLLALMTRIVTNAAGLRPNTSAATRDRAVGRALDALTDPVVLTILRELSEKVALSPPALEARCRPTPRRTVYRRLTPLVEAGVVVRSTTGQVPRSTAYTLNDDWRPAAAIQLLSTWWSTRHPQVAGAVEDPDLDGLLHSILPRTKLTKGFHGSVLWVVTGSPRDPLRLSAHGQTISLDFSTPEHPTDATIQGGAADWAAGLVSGNRDGLTTSGDRDLADAVFAAVRAAALSYVR